MSEQRRYAVCIRNEGYEGALELRKLYELLPDAAAAERRHVRLVDESGEDYLYPADWFLTIDVPQNVETALRQLTTSQ